VKPSYAALGTVAFAIAGLWYLGGGTTLPSGQAAVAGELRVSAPVTHENLTIYFIHGQNAVADAKVATLQEAMEAGWP
jgi:hypothetical protein